MSAETGAGICCAFLHLETVNAGHIKGESSAKGYDGDIEVLGWNWSARSASATGNAVSNPSCSYSSLTIRKTVDAASMLLLKSMKKNDEVASAKLCVLRGQGKPVSMTIALRRARIASLALSMDAHGGVEELLVLDFSEVQCSYRPQTADGVLGATFSFEDSLKTGAGM